MKKISFKKIDNSVYIFESKSKDLFELDNIDILKKEIYKSESKTINQGKIDPKDIQRLVRAGYTNDEISNRIKIEKSIIERYSMPIIAEINFVIEKAKRVKPINSNSNTILDMINSKLYNSDDIKWVAKKPNSTWLIIITWSENSKKSKADFSLDSSLKILTPLNDKANDLINTDKPGKSKMDIFSDTILNDLDSARGKHQVVEDEIFDDGLLNDNFNDDNTNFDAKKPDYAINLTETLKNTKQKNNIVKFPNNNENNTDAINSKDSSSNKNSSTNEGFIDTLENNITDDNNKTHSTEETNINTEQNENNKNTTNDNFMSEQKDERKNEQLAEQKDEQKDNIEKTTKQETSQREKKDEQNDNVENTTKSENSQSEKKDEQKNNTTGSTKRTSVPSWDDIIFGSNDD